MLRTLRVLPAALVACAVAFDCAAQNPAVRPIDPDSIAQSRVVISIQPVGSIPYDGLVLPLTSPDGRFMATQSGRTPGWEVLLADKAAKPPAGLAVSAYAIPIDPQPAPASDKEQKNKKDKKDEKPKPATLSRVSWNKPLPAGLLLGRAADNAGFLVEAPQASGTRWIGKVAWLSGELTWLVREPDSKTVNFHPAFGNDGAIVYMRRLADGIATQLVVRSRKGETWSEISHTAAEGEILDFPFFSPDGSIVVAFAVPAADLAAGTVSLVAFVRPNADEGHTLSLTEISRLELGRGGLIAAYQSAAALQMPATLPPRPAAERPEAGTIRAGFAAGVTVLSMRDGSTVWWEPRLSQVVPFAPRSAAAVPFQHDELGVLLATDKDLMYQPLRAGKTPDKALDAGRPVSVMGGRSIPRSTSHESGVTVVLTPPGSGAENAFNVILIRPSKPD